MTGILRLKLLNAFWQRRLRDGHVIGPIRILILTYNRTLRGYVEELARDQVDASVDIDISTFGRWSTRLLPGRSMPDANDHLRRLGSALDLPSRFLQEEADYVMGRFLPARFNDYLRARREGRGTTPRMEQPHRQALLDEVIRPYMDWKETQGLCDWNDLAVELAQSQSTSPYHIVIVDEAQDFSANQVRAIMNHVTEPHSVTYIVDAVQRIYPRGFTSWREAGVDIVNSYRLSTNYRNTKEIASFAHPLVADLPLHDDGTLPDFSSCERSGSLPRLVLGHFAQQMDYLISEIDHLSSSTEDSIAILHSRGWFGEVKRRLRSAGIQYSELTRSPEWPSGDEQVALSTMHSAKGLEFDHVYIVGLNAEVSPIGDDDETSEQHYRRLLAMAICRARKTVTISYKPSEASLLIDFLDPATYERIDL